MRKPRLGSLRTAKRVLGELLLIIAGVLSALALDSWWEDQQDRQEETAYLEQLLLDLREMEYRVQDSIEGDSSMLVRVGGILDRALNGPYPPRDSLGLPTGYTQFRPLTGTQTALVQSGDLRLLRNDSIRFALVAYGSLVDATESLLRHTETLIWGSTQNVMLARARHSRSGVIRPGTRWGDVDVGAVLGDPEVISALRVHVAASANRVRNLQRLEEPTADLIRLLQTELGRL
jgi:hypothetical protein